MKNQIVIKNARLHNLKNISVSLPKNKLVVLTGVSGSGKSTLAFDTLHKEGQRQYMESMGMVTDFLSKPEVDSIQGLSPSISVDQHLTNRSPRSTVGTSTEIFTYLRVLFAKVGSRPCPTCKTVIPPSYHVNGATLWDDETGSSELDTSFDFENSYPCPQCGTSILELGMTHFSFNKPAGACPTCTGLGTIHKANLKQLLNKDLSILEGGVVRWDKHEIARYQKTLQVAALHFGFTFDPAEPIKQLGPLQRDLLLYGVHSPQFRHHHPHIEPPETAAKGRFEGVVTNLLRRYSENANNAGYRQKMEKLLYGQLCPDCNGSRLREESRAVRVAGKSIVDVSQLALTELTAWIEQLSTDNSAEEWRIVEPIITDLRGRIQRLVDVGVGYLTLEPLRAHLVGR